jgi:hypothetical protein
VMTRVDIFSTKGGVGKTTISFLLASLQAEKGRKPVLLVDADLTGTCLGDLIQPWAEPSWHSRMNLIHLICTTVPERLKDLLREQLPVYKYEPQAGPGQQAQRLTGGTGGNTLLFCPSHAYATQPTAIPASVLHALLGHESAGGWVQYVIEELIQVTRDKAGELGAVVVDHGPGIGALQDAILQSLKAEDKDTQRLALVVTSRDGVDLASTAEFDQKHLVHLDQKMREKKVVWAVNRVQRTEGVDWRQSVKQGLSESVISRTSETGLERKYWRDWFEKSAFPLYQDEAFARAYSRSALNEAGRLGADLEPLRARIFGS